MTPKKKAAGKRGRGQPKTPILKIATVAGALVELRGNVSAVARRFGVTRSAVHNLIAANDDLRTITADCREQGLDDAEDSLMKAVTEGEAWAVCFFLKTQGKKRGYVERQEIEHSDKPKHVIIIDDQTVEPAEEVH